MSARPTKLPGLADIVGLVHRAPKALESALERNAVALAATTAALLIAVAVFAAIRHRNQHQALSNRIAYDLLPTTDFDPKDEEIHRFARLLQRTRPAASGLTPRRAAAVRIRLHTGETGRLGYRVEGSARAAATLGQQAYAAVELRAVEAPPAEPGGSAADPTDQGGTP